MSENLKDIHLVNELPSTFLDVEEQLKSDDKRWGNEWKKRGLVFENKEQEERFFEKILSYFNDYINFGIPMPWDKIIGEAHICKVRERILTK